MEIMINNDNGSDKNNKNVNGNNTSIKMTVITIIITIVTRICIVRLQHFCNMMKRAFLQHRICSNNAFFDQRCNELEHCIDEQGYSERVARQEILKVQKIPRNELLEKERNHPEGNKLTFNITYYPAFQNTKTILEELQILLAPDKEHQKVFLNVPIVGFYNGKSLKDHLVRASLPVLNHTLDGEPYGKRNCQVCQFIINTDTIQPNNNK